MSMTAARIAKYGWTIVLAAALTAALVLKGQSTGPAAPSVPQPFGLDDIALAAATANDIFVEVPTFTGGESTSEKHPGVSTATRVESSLTRTGTATRTTPAVSIEKPIDSYTPQFAKVTNLGTHIQQVILYMEKAGEAPFDF